MALLEREDALTALDDRIAAASAGRGSVVLVEGPAGIGKTALLEAADELALRAGASVRRARAGALESELGWNLARQLFADVVGADEGEQAELLRGAASLSAPALGLAAGTEAGALHGLYWLTVSLAQNRPLLLAVDDSHWGDAPSLAYLAYLGQRIGDLGVVLAVALRSGERVSEPLRAFAGDPRIERIELAELSPAAAAALTRAELGPRAADEFCDACQRSSAGNPFLLHELLDQLRRDGIEPSAENAVGVASVTPETVVRSVLMRLSAIGADARELAIAVAILGSGAELAVAGEMAGLDADRLAAAADELARLGILVPGAPLEFVHPIVREAIYADLPAIARAGRHRDGARVLAAAGAGPQRIAAQLLKTEPAADRWVVEQLSAAASEAISEGSPALAADLLGRAAREPAPPGEASGVLWQLGRCEAAIGRATAAQHLQEAASAAAEPPSRARVLLDLGRALYIAGDPLQAAATLDRALSDLAAADCEEPALVAELRAGWLTTARVEISLRSRAVELTETIIERPPGGESYGERALLAQVAGQLTFEGEPREKALELARLALGDGDLIRQETSDGMSWVAAMGALGWGDDFDGYEALQEMAIADARRRGSVIGFATANYGLSFSHYYRGMLVEAIADAQRAIDAEVDGWRQFLPAARAQLAWALIERGELAAAQSTLEEAERDPGWEGSSMQALVLEARARVHIARGEHGAALEAALAAGRVFEEARVINPSVVPWRSRAALAAARLGETEQAEALLEDALRLSRRFGAPRPIGVALMAAGEARRERGIEHLQEAVEVLTDSPARLEYVRALVLLGAALRRQGKRRDAGEVLRKGLDASAALGAIVLGERARSELVALGLRPRRRRTSGIEALTPAELRVAELAARGMANREIAESLFVSLRTIEVHLTRSYRKLGIHSRDGLGTALLRTEAAAPRPDLEP